MSKILLAVAVFAVAAYAAPGAIPSAAEAKAELEAAGVSSATADGIISIAEKYKTQFEQGKTDKEAGKQAFTEFHAEVETYLKTQSSADQTAYASFIEKKKAEHHSRHSTPSA